MSAPHFTTRFLEPRHQSLTTVWVQFVSVILALSGAESIANLTGVMKLDPGSTMEHPSVAREIAQGDYAGGDRGCHWHGAPRMGNAFTAFRPRIRHCILTDTGAIAAVLGQRVKTCCASSASSLPPPHFRPRVGQIFGWIVGIVFCLLLLSAANTAIVAMIGLLYMMSRDREMPRQFRRLNRHGVPVWPLFIASGLPSGRAAFAANFTALAGLYAIGVVGAITVNVGSCTFNRTMGFT